jgi:hypothetical protein
MTDQQLVVSALRQVGLVLAQHIELGARDADEVVTQLIAVLDTQELADAMNRLERGHGLRVVK